MPQHWRWSLYPSPYQGLVPPASTGLLVPPPARAQHRLALRPATKLLSKQGLGSWRNKWSRLPCSARGRGVRHPRGRRACLHWGALKGGPGPEGEGAGVTLPQPIPETLAQPSEPRPRLPDLGPASQGREAAAPTSAGRGRPPSIWADMVRSNLSSPEQIMTCQQGDGTSQGQQAGRRDRERRRAGHQEPPTRLPPRPSVTT